ncbi:2-oxoglutarate-dependent dioxygenase DAO-like [Pyrus ussuriensis x Pyrus communis]|uniref:2-oxoglutarate-dependent dioxygenase DAO-like n=1 Tax=Pyrus ussuriensis x Pyrus communis TaxID=2448454 RepID=A0A5N5IFZ4_9ROSA|nr:2-oxoglutarate-dependent dioxygenase DAO-like [Pyrus ussuriensis x Pyrus communis]
MVEEEEKKGRERLRERVDNGINEKVNGYCCPKIYNFKQNKDVIAGSGYMAPGSFNPLYEDLGLHDMGSRQAVECFCSQLDASSYHITTWVSF